MHRRILPFVALVLLLAAHGAQAWWNQDWAIRKKITLDTADTGAPIQGDIGTSVVLVRLHDGNFQFGAARADGGDIRFVAGDEKTVLPHQIEKYDSLLNEAFVWVKVPDIKPGASTSFWLYYGNPEGSAEKPKELYDADTSLVYHFAEQGTAPADSTDLGNNAQEAGTPAAGAIIGTGLRAIGKPLTTADSGSLAWNAGQALTWSAWVKPAALQPNAVIFSRREGPNAFVLGLDNGVPYVEVTDASGTRRSGPGEAFTAGTWRHLAAVGDASSISLHVDGQPYAVLAGTVPALAGPIEFGAFNGELDELQIARVARPVGALKFAAVNQGGSEAAQKLLVPGEDESAGHGSAGGEALEHLSLFGDIANNMMFDGWVVIFCCMIMALVGWTVALRKFFYLNKIQKGSDEFLRQWKEVATDLTVLDHTDAENVKSLGGKVSEKKQRLMRQSPLYHIYHIGSEEIRHRLQRGTFQGLSARSIQAIKASLDAGLQHELHKLSNGLVYLTISIAGGPYVGLLGTVMGVMITFAVIAKSGEVEVNSIAPGIASALLATVAGLVVAIPALFIYSYLNSRIKTAASHMQLFIDEFITKMAEFYPTPADLSQPVSRYAPEGAVSK